MYRDCLALGKRRDQWIWRGIFSGAFAGTTTTFRAGLGHGRKETVRVSSAGVAQ